MTEPLPPLDPLRIAITGHVDHGKSTLVGRLFHETGRLPEGKFEELQRIAERRGVPFEWANLTDALQAERDQNITIDTAQIWFRTARRLCVLIDTPGHKEFLKHMVTGAARADAAMLLIDAEEGVQENSRRHGYLLHLVGLRQLVVLVNKMDLVEFSETRFREIEAEYRQFLKTLGMEMAHCLPVSARHGENIARPGPNLAWWTGPSVLDVLDGFPAAGRLDQQPLRFAVQDVYRFDERRVLAGRVESGTLRVGDSLVFVPGHKTSTVKTIERWSAPGEEPAPAGESVGITLTEQIFAERGAVAAHADTPPYELTRFRTRVFWMGHNPLRRGRRYKLKLVAQEVDCEIESIEKVVDTSTLATLSRHHNEVFVGRHEVGELTLRTKRPIALDVHAELPVTGRFVLVDGYQISGGGVVLPDAYPRRVSHGHPKSENLYQSARRVSAEQRAHQNGHPGCILWLTGLSGSGKSTLAAELEARLFGMGRHVYVLEGDNVRQGLCSDLGFSPKDRTENIRRVGEVALLFADSGAICIAAFISPYRADRELVRQKSRPGQFVEVHLNAPVEICAQRDPKGLYARAKTNEIRDFTGVSAPYEPPSHPELELRTDQLSVEECVTRILECLPKTKGDPKFGQGAAS